MRPPTESVVAWLVRHRSRLPRFLRAIPDAVERNPDGWLSRLAYRVYGGDARAPHPTPAPEGDPRILIGPANYAGQGWEIPVTLTPAEARAADPAVILQRFEHEYANLFGRTVKGLAAEITVWSVNAHTPQEAIAPVAPLSGMRDAPAEGSRSVFDAGLGRRVEAEAHSRTALPAGSRISGPGIITEDETTIVLPSSRIGITLTDGCIDIRLPEAAPAIRTADRKEPAHV